MFRFLFALFAVIGIAHPIYSQAPEKPKGRKVAFLVSVSDYRGTGLRLLEHAETETEFFAVSLEVSGYSKGDIIRYSGKEAVGKDILSFRRNADSLLKELDMTCKSLSAEDTLLFAFNGHCAKVEKFKDKGLMLFPEGVRFASEESMIPLSRIYEMFEKNCKAKEKLILLSPYRSDLTNDKLTEERLGTLFCPQIPTPPKSVILISSCGQFEQSPVTKQGMNPYFVKLVETFSRRPTGKPTLTGANIIQALKPIIPASDVADFVKGDLKEFESRVLADVLTRSLTDWAEYAGTNRKVIFENNEPVAAIVETEIDKEKSLFSIVQPMTKKIIVPRIQRDTYPLVSGFSSDGKQAFATIDKPATVIVDSKSGEEIQTVKHPTPDEILPEEITRACFSPRDDFFLSCDRHGNVVVWDLKAKKHLHILAHDSRISDACFLQGGLSFVTVSEKGLVQIWSTKSAKCLWKLQLPTVAYSLSPSPDGVSLAIGRRDGKLLICNAITGEIKSSEKLGIGAVTQICFTPNGRSLVAIGWDKMVSFWDMDADEYTFLRHDSLVSSATFSPDGAFLATGDRKGVVKLWNPKTGEKIRSFECEDWITHLAYSPDGKKLVAILHEGEPQVWDISTGKRLDKVEAKKKD